MSIEQKSINISFRITDISVKKFELIPAEIPVGFSYTDYQFQLKTLSKIESGDKIISIITYIDVYLDKELTKKIIVFESEIKYSIDNFAEIVVYVDNILQIPDIVVKTFLGVSISTVRGILFSRSEETQYKKVYLPVIDISKLSPQIIDPKELNM